MKTSAFIILCTAALFFTALLSAEEVRLSPGDRVIVHWRTIPAGANILRHTGPFTSKGTVTAVKSPFGDGGISGSSIISLVKSKKMKGTVMECRALLFPAGADRSTANPRASIVIKNDDSLYDSYVVRDKDNAPALYVFVVVK